MKVAIIVPCLESKKNIIRDVLYGCWCGGKRIAGATVPPYEDLRVATILKSAGHDVIFIDAQAEQLSAQDVISRLEGVRLAATSSSVMTINSDAKFVRQLKAKIPNLLVASYGSHSTFLPEETLKKGIDFAINKEPEWVLKELVEALR